MFITPMQKIGGIGSSQISGVSTIPQTSIGNTFKDILQNAIETDKTAANDLQLLATGEIDDLHTLTIDQTKAQLSIDLLVQIRNKLMESYSEVMRINL